MFLHWERACVFWGWEGETRGDRDTDRGEREEERGKDKEGGRDIYVEREMLERDKGKRERGREGGRDR